MYVYKHLKERSYYEDLYDRITVDACRRSEKAFEKAFEKRFTRGKKKYVFTLANPFIHFEKGEYYLKREDTIREWMERDRKLDEKIEKAIAPVSKCQFCGDELELFDKSTEYGEEKQDQVVFNYRCVRCKYGRKIWEDGTTKDTIPWECPKCGSKMNHNSKRKGDIIHTKDDCPHCGYEDSDSFSLAHKEPEKPNPEKEKQFYLDKKKYCMPPAEGEEYRRSKERMSELSEMMKGIDKRKEQDDVLKKIRKLTIVQVEKDLINTLKSGGFEHLHFEPPNTHQGVMVSFSVQDKRIRQEYDSKKAAKKIITTTLGDTNWRLMSEGLDCRLGILTGRLRGYELEEDLLKLIKPKE